LVRLRELNGLEEMMPTIGWFELVLILVIVTMLFGVGKLPEVFGAVGKGIREFRQNAGDPNATNGATTVEQTKPVGTASPPQLQLEEPASAQSVHTEQPQQPQPDQTRAL
jgi:sec-independent protein translocase protein TatA